MSKRSTPQTIEIEIVYCGEGKANGSPREHMIWTQTDQDSQTLHRDIIRTSSEFSNFDMRFSSLNVPQLLCSTHMLTNVLSVYANSIPPRKIAPLPNQRSSRDIS